MSYVLPQVLVFQDFTTNPAAVANPLRANVSGGHAYLCRYSQDDERELGFLGYYDPEIDSEYLWPQRPAGGRVDPSYTKLRMKNALLRYFADSVSSGSEVVKVADHNNRIRSSTVSFATNGAYLRDAQLGDRDVQPGDVVKLRVFPDGSDPLTIWTTVRRLIGDDVASVVSAATADDNNAGNTVAAAMILQTAGDDNCVKPTASAAGYDGLASGHPLEVYTVRVIEGSVGGDLSLARLRILSASGTDDATNVTPEDLNSPTDIGRRGLTMTFALGGNAGDSEAADSEGVGYDDLIVGQEWEIHVRQTFSAPTATSGGTYGGTADTTYIVEVVTGGDWVDLPTIKVSTTNGIDLGNPVVVRGSGSSKAVTVGQYGVTIYFTGTGLCGGDRYYIPVTGVAEGPMRTIEVMNNIPATVLDDSEVDLALFIRKPDLAIDQDRVGFAPDLNWEQNATQITVKSGMVAYDSSWTVDGVQQPLDVVAASSKQYGRLYTEYRAWLPDLSSAINGVSDVGALDTAISGPLTPDNPLKWGVFKALTNSNGTEVTFIAVANPADPDSWAVALELLVGREDNYGLVPLTRDSTVLGMFESHVNSMSGADHALWRVLWCNLAGVPTIPLVSDGSDVAGHREATTSDGEVCLATFEDDPTTAGSQYTRLICPAGNGAFVTNGVTAGDVVRALYSNDGFGDFSYTEYVIDEVESEDQLRLVTGPAAPQSIPAKIEIWRNLSAAAEATEIALTAGSWENRRVRAVWPDTVESGGTVQEGYFLCCALAGLVSGVLPHQGLTNVAVAGFTAVPRTTQKFNRDQLDVLAAAGVWIVTQSPSSGEIYTRDAITTGNYEDLNQRAEMLTRNVDSVSYRFKDQFAPYIGVTNVTPTMIAKVEREARLLVGVLESENATEDLGGQMISGELVSVTQHPLLKNRIEVVINGEFPYATDTIAIHVVV